MVRLLEPALPPLGAGQYPKGDGTNVVAGDFAADVATTPASEARAHAFDPLTDFRITSFSAFTPWLRANNAKGYIGEIGWPNAVDTERWNEVGEAWYRHADANDLWVTYWPGGIGGNNINAYGATGGFAGTIDTRYPPADVVERHPTTARYQRGVNVSGPQSDWGPNGATFSAATPGTYGTDWWYPNLASLQYLATAGVKLIRLPISWERIQPTLLGALDSAESTRLTTCLSNASTAGLTVIVDVHNGGQYIPTHGTVYTIQLSGGSLNASHLIDLWRRLSDLLKGNSALAGYGLMNEPTSAIPGSFSPNTTLYTFDSNITGWAVRSSPTGASLSYDTTVKDTGAGSLKLTVTGANVANGYNQFYVEIYTTTDTGSGGAIKLRARKAAGAGGTWNIYPYRINGSWADKLSAQSGQLVDNTWVDVVGATDMTGGIQGWGCFVTTNNGVAGTDLVINIDTYQRGDNLSSDDVWHTISQQVVTDLRTTKSDTTLLLVAGASFGAVSSWVSHNPTGWITDSANNFRYEAHDYFDDLSAYSSTYDTYRDSAYAAGYGVGYRNSDVVARHRLRVNSGSDIGTPQRRLNVVGAGSTTVAATDGGSNGEHVLTITGGKAAAQANSTASTVSGLVTDFNALLAKLQAAGLMS